MGAGRPPMVGGQQSGVVPGAPQGERSLAGLELESCFGQTPSSHAVCRRRRELPARIERSRPLYYRSETRIAGRSIEGLPAGTSFSRANPALSVDSGNNAIAMGARAEATVLGAQSAVGTRTARDNRRDRCLEGAGRSGRGISFGERTQSSREIPFVGGEGFFRPRACGLHLCGRRSVDLAKLGTTASSAFKGDRPGEGVDP